jgi:hypothetical protein
MGRTKKQKNQNEVENKLTYQNITRTDVNRFIGNIPGNWDDNIYQTCLHWSGKVKYLNKKTYIIRPIFRIRKKIYDARRISLLIIKKKDIYAYDNGYIQTTCDNQYCVNPEHMILC